MSKRDLASLLLSALLHFIAIFAVLSSHSGRSNGSGPSDKGSPQDEGRPADQGMDVKVKPHQELVEVTMIEVPTIVKKGAINKTKAKKIVKEECKGQKWFGGIGVNVGYGRGVGLELIEYVYPGYPADRAGILAGDIIMSLDTPSIIGKIGTPVNLLINRGNQMINITVIRGKICY